LIVLPHPRTGALARYLLQDQGRTLLEVVALDAPYRSWFVDDHVVEDGRLLVFAPVHPLFLVLPALERTTLRRRGTTRCTAFTPPHAWLTRQARGRT
jgi:hypothetical protein